MQGLIGLHAGVKPGDDGRASDAGIPSTWGMFIDARVTPATASRTAPLWFKDQGRQEGLLASLSAVTLVLRQASERAPAV